MPFLEFVNPLLVFVIVACHKFLTLRNMDLSFRRLTNTETAFMINKCVLYVRINICQVGLDMWNEWLLVVNGWDINFLFTLGIHIRLKCFFNCANPYRLTPYEYYLDQCIVIIWDVTRRKISLGAQTCKSLSVLSHNIG